MRFVWVSLRIYPHLQDSGGFFVAVLEKKTKVIDPVEQSLRYVRVPSVSKLVDGLYHQG